jgi:hypothetical protein
VDERRSLFSVRLSIAAIHLACSRVSIWLRAITYGATLQLGFVRLLTMLGGFAWPAVQVPLQHRHHWHDQESVDAREPHAECHEGHDLPLVGRIPAGPRWQGRI